MDSGTEPFHCTIRERTLVAKKKKLQVSEMKNASPEVRAEVCLDRAVLVIDRMTGFSPGSRPRAAMKLGRQHGD